MKTSFPTPEEAIQRHNIKELPLNLTHDIKILGSSDLPGLHNELNILKKGPNYLIPKQLLIICTTFSIFKCNCVDNCTSRYLLKLAKMVEQRLIAKKIETYT